MSRTIPEGTVDSLALTCWECNHALRGKPWQERRLHEEKHGRPSLGWLSDLCSLVNLVCLPETQDIEFKSDLQRKDMEDPHPIPAKGVDPGTTLSTRPGMDGHLTPHEPDSFLFQNVGSLTFHFP